MEQANKRKLVSIRTIASVEPIPNADAIEVAVVDGWKVVTKKGEFKAGDLCVYFEIDSFLPDGEPAWQFLVDKSSRIFEGVKGHKLRSIKLRGVTSQGLVLPIQFAVDRFVDSEFDEGQEIGEFFTVGADISEFLGVKKWEAALPAELVGQAQGLFPSFIRKTDQERCVSGDTLVATEAGNIRMDVLVYMDKKPAVWSYNHATGENELKPVISVSVQPPSGRWLKIKTASGRELIVTDNHRIWIHDQQSYATADQLKIGQKLRLKN